MKKYGRHLLVPLVCFLIVIVLNFALPRLLPGNPVAYLTGMAEEDMTATQIEYYENALHLKDSLPVQFGYYLISLLDGSLGYSFKKQAVVSQLIMDRLGYTLQITLPSVVISTVIGLFWGLHAGYHKNSRRDQISTSGLIVLNTVPTFLVGLVLVIVCCFQHKWFPYIGINSRGVQPGTVAYVLDRMHHLFLPILTLTVTTVPSRYLLMRNTARKIVDEKYILYARARGLSERKIILSYMLKNIAQPFITMVGMSVSLCVGGSLVIENIFSINGMGKLLTEAVYSLDYPLMQGILFVTTGIMVISIVITDLINLIIDPKIRLGEPHCEK